MKKMMLIVNPNAGRSAYKNALGEMLRIFCDSGYAPTVYFTKSVGDCKALTQKYAAENELLVCMGGDGTLSEVAAGLAEVQNAPEIGYIPMGTTNDVASSLGISKNTDIAAKTAANGSAISLDVGVFNGDNYFTYIAAFGAFTDVSYQTPQQNKQALGHLAYVIEGMTRLPKLPNVSAEIWHDNGVLTGDFIFGAVANSHSLGGIVHLDEELVSLADGYFELILVRTPKNIIELQEALAEYISQNYDGKHIKVIKTKKVRFAFKESVPWTRDGENGGEHTVVEIENIQHAMRIRTSNSTIS